MSSIHPSLLIFTTSQSPLAIRTPRPRKPVLNLPAIVHRTLHSALDATPPSHLTTANQTILIPHPDSLVKHDIPSDHDHPSTSHATDAEEINGSSEPAAGGAGSSKGEELEAEITVKIHLVGNGSSTDRATWVSEALGALRQHKGLSEVDTVLIGWKGIDYKGKRTAAADFFGCGAEGLTSDVSGSVLEDTAKGARAVWELVNQDESVKSAKQVGTLYLPLEVLRDLTATSCPPKVNSLDTPDCHSLPQEYKAFAKESGIELWAGGGGEGSDPLPDADLHNLLNEFVSVIPTSGSEEFSPSTNGVEAASHGPLAQVIPLREDELKFDESQKRGVAVRWVLSYTLVSKSRNVLKDKGYIIAADLLV